MNKNNNPNINTDSWEFSLEAILAEYAEAPEPEKLRTPEETRSRAIVMEAISDRIAASVESQTDFAEETAQARAKKPVQDTPRLKKSAAQPPKAADPAPKQEILRDTEGFAFSVTDILAEAEAEAQRKKVRAPEVEAKPVEPEASEATAEPEAPEATAELEASEATAEPEASEVEAVDVDSGADTDYASEDYPPYADAEEERERADEAHGGAYKRPNILVSLMAALLIRRQQRAKAKPVEEAKAAAEQEAMPEVSLKSASMYYLKSAGPFKYRSMAAAALSLILLYIAWGLPLAGAMKDLRICAGMCLILELSVILLGLDVFTAGITALLRGKPALESLVSVSCVFSALDALILFCGGKQHGLPYCAVSAVTMTLALLGSRYLCMGLARSFHTAALTANPVVVTAEEGALPDGSVLIKSERDTEGFVKRSQHADLVESAYAVAAPILLIAAPVLAFLATVLRKQAGDFFHCLSALTAVSTSFSALLCFTLPFSVVARRLAASGAALAGWAGCADIGESRRTVVTDGDIFPAGNVLIDTIRILEGVYTDKVISYTGSVIVASGCGLVPAFTDLMHRNGCAMHQVENFACHKGGGLTATVRGEQVFVGSSSFMNLMGIRLPQSQMAKTSVFVAISGELVGVFSIRYTPTASIQEALVSLLHSRKGAPLFAIRDFNITPLLIKQRFRMPAEGFEFPAFPERYRISAITSAKHSAPAALLARKGLGAYAETAQTGRGLYNGSRLCLLLSLICSVLGMLLMFFLCATGSYESASVGNILIFMLFWLAPVILVALSLRR